MNPITAFIVVFLLVAGGAAGMFVSLLLAPVFVIAAILVASTLKMANAWQKFVILRAGKLQSVKGPGLFLILPIIDSVTAVIDERIQTTGFNAEQALTKDTVPVNVDAIIFWHVHDAQKAALAITDYRQAIDTVGAEPQVGPGPRPSISIKLSAIDPRYEAAQFATVQRRMMPRLLALVDAAASANLNLTIDAEEMDRLELSLDLIEALALDSELAGWDGLGMAVQAYQKRALATVEWLADLAHRSGHRFGLRLVKGAYWDAEVKATQERGLSNYPVFTRKVSSDVAYLACAKRLFADPVAFYPAFATHNAHTLAAIAEIAGDYQFLPNDERVGYHQMRKVNWLRTYSPSLPKEQLFLKSLSIHAEMIRSKEAQKASIIKSSKISCFSSISCSKSKISSFN